MYLDESRTLHAFNDWWVESYLNMWIGVYVHWWIFGDCCGYLNKVNCMHCLIVLVYLLAYDNVEFIDQAELNCVIYFHLIMFNYELWTNPQWSFGWPPTLFVWMGRHRARIVCICLASCWRLALKLPRFAFGVYRVRLWFRCVCLFISIMSWGDFY